MAIDAATLSNQRISLVKNYDGPCNRCGRRTRDKTRVCSPCRRSAPDLTRLTPEQIVGLMDMCSAELERRRTQLDAMLARRLL